MNGTDITVKVASTAAEIEGLRAFWSRLNRHPESDLDFVLMLAATRPEVLRPCILAAYQGAEPVAMMIGRVEKSVVNIKLGYLTLLKIPVTRLVFVREGFLGECSERVAGPMIAQIAKAFEGLAVDISLLSNVPVTSSLHELMRSRCPAFRRDFAHRRIEHWRTKLPETFEAFLAARRNRRHFKRIFRIFETEFAGKIRYGVFKAVADVIPFCKAANTVAQSTYQRGLNAGFVDSEENRRRLTLFAQKGWLRAYVLFVGEEPIAFWCGEQLKDVVFLSWTGFNPAYRKFEVGTILYLKMVEDLISQGVREMDYGLGGAHYKERFGDSCLEEQDIAIYAPTLKGVGVNLICTIVHLINRIGMKLLSLLNIRERLKRKWRSELAGEASPLVGHRNTAPPTGVQPGSS